MPMASADGKELVRNAASATPLKSADKREPAPNTADRNEIMR